MKTPYIAYPTPFQILPNPSSLSPPTPTPTALSVVLFLQLNGWSCHICCGILLNDIMDLHMSSFGTLVPEGPWCVFYATRHQVYWGLAHLIFYWCSDLITHTHTYTKIHSTGTSGLTHPYNIFTSLVTSSQQLSLIERIIHYIKNLLSTRSFIFKKYSHDFSRNWKMKLAENW